MTRLISHYEQSFGYSEEEEAERLKNTYGWSRACQLAEVFEKTDCRVYRAFWFRVQALLAESPHDIPVTPMKRDPERQLVGNPNRIKVAGVSVTRAEFLRWLSNKGTAQA